MLVVLILLQVVLPSVSLYELSWQLLNPDMWTSDVERSDSHALFIGTESKLARASESRIPSREAFELSAKVMNGVIGKDSAL